MNIHSLPCWISECIKNQFIAMIYRIRTLLQNKFFSSSFSKITFSIENFLNNTELPIFRLKFLKFCKLPLYFSKNFTFNNSFYTTKKLLTRSAQTFYWRLMEFIWQIYGKYEKFFSFGRHLTAMKILWQSGNKQKISFISREVYQFHKFSPFHLKKGKFSHSKKKNKGKKIWQINRHRAAK